jgi:demethylmenaquinone methyltransferase/2-methoxy-6-polyprenyl-1,4-benzoquinol methylase
MFNKAHTPRMFDQLAPHYDAFNHLFSLGLDLAWRRTAAKHLPNRVGLRLLDVATGTGDQLLSLARHAKQPAVLHGMDPSSGMLEICRRKLRKANLTASVNLHTGTAEQIPFDAQSVDVVTTSFGIRNFSDPQQALQEFHRVLAPGGMVMVLELSIPSQWWIRLPYLFFFRRILPVLGGWLFGSRGAFKYLNQSVEAFPQNAAFCAWMEAAGFREVHSRPLTWGIATLYWGERAT